MGASDNFARIAHAINSVETHVSPMGRPQQARIAHAINSVETHGDDVWGNNVKRVLRMLLIALKHLCLCIWYILYKRVLRMLLIALKPVRRQQQLLPWRVLRMLLIALKHTAAVSAWPTARVLRMLLIALKPFPYRLRVWR